MAKKKNTVDKARLFYRGPETKPSKVADDDEMKVIVDALSFCFQNKDCGFKTKWQGKDTSLKLVVGLSAGLRCIKQKRTEAIIYDDTASPHLTKYLNEFARQSKFPIIQAHRLIDIAPKFKLQTLLLLSFIKSNVDQEELYRNNGNPRPKPIKETLSSDLFEKLSLLLQSSFVSSSEDTVFRLPILERVQSTGRSQAKKAKKKQLAEIKKRQKADCEAEQKHTHVVESV